MQPNERYGAFLLYVDDWLSSSAIEAMTAAEERGYLRLLMHAWKSDDCGLPDDDAVLAQLSKLGRAWSRNSNSGATIRAQFIAKNGRLYNERLLREREHQQRVRESRTRAAQVANSVRWGIRDGCVSGPNSKLETIYTNRSEERLTLITPERIERVQSALRVHRGRLDGPDERITRRILLLFEDDATLSRWLADLGTGVDPATITGDGYGFYEADARRWIERGGVRPARRPKRAELPASTMDPETRRRIQALHAAERKPKYFDPKTITGEDPIRQC